MDKEEEFLEALVLGLLLDIIGPVELLYLCDAVLKARRAN